MIASGKSDRRAGPLIRAKDRLKNWLKTVNSPIRIFLRSSGLNLTVKSQIFNEVLGNICHQPSNEVLNGLNPPNGLHFIFKPHSNEGIVCHKPSI